MQRVSFLSDGLKLAGQLRLPQADNDIPVLCICHGIPAVPFNPEDTGYADLATRFTEEGFATLLFNFRGAGLSEGNFDMRGWARDLTQALSFIESVPGIDASAMYVMGFSGGAATALYVAAHDKRVAGVVSCASPANFDELTNERVLDDHVARWREINIIRDAAFPENFGEWKAGFAEVGPATHISAISPRPVLLLHGDADEVVGVAHAHLLSESAGEPCDLVVLPGGLHRLRVDDRAMNLALDWLLCERVG
jgi:dipeptidyl aminopeptidase/acylaminoacyl peptidase